MNLNAILSALKYLKGGADTVGNFIAPVIPKTYNMLGNIGGAIGDTFNYNRAQNDQERQQSAQSFTQRANDINKTQSEFGFGDKGFNPLKFATGELGGAAQIAALTAPLSKGISAGAGALEQLAKLGYNAAPTAIESATQGDNPQTIAIKSALAGIGGRGGEKLADLGGAALKGLGGFMKTKGDQIGLDVLGLTSLDKNKIQDKLGAKVNDVLKQYGVFGKPVEDIQSLEHGFQNQFDSMAKDPSLMLSAPELQKSFQSKINPLLQSNFSENRTAGKGLQDYLDRLTKKPDMPNATPLLSGSDLTGERRTADQLVKTFQNSDVNKSTNQHIREALQSSIRDKADQLGLKTASGDSLTDVGKKLNDLYSITDIAQKRQGKSRTLYNLLASSVGSGLGGLMGGPVGFAAGAAAAPVARELLTSPNASKAAAAGLEGLGGATQGLGKLAGALGPLDRILGQKTGEAIAPTVAPQLQNSPQQPMQNNQNTQQEVDPNTEVTLLNGQKVKLSDHLNTLKQFKNQPPANPQGAQGVQGVQKPTGSPDSINGMTPDILKQLMLKDVLTNKGRNMTQLQALNKVLFPSTTGAAKKMTEKQTQYQAAGEGAQHALDLLNKADIKVGPVEGRIQEALAATTGGVSNDQQDFMSTIALARSSLLNAFLGGNIPPAEYARIQAGIPTVQDPKNIAKQKLSTFIREMGSLSNKDVATTQINTQSQDPLNALFQNSQ